MKLTIVLADDHRILRQGLKLAIELEQGMKVVGEAGNGLEAVRLALEFRPRVVVMDVNMPELNGIEATRRIRSQAPDIFVIGLSMYFDKRYVLGMLQAGASGYLLKTCSYEELAEALRLVGSGKTYLSAEVAGVVIQSALDQNSGRESHLPGGLTPREKEVLQLVAEGKSTREIADLLELSERTVETHRRRIMVKLNLKNVAELTRYAVREGLTSLYP